MITEPDKSGGLGSFPQDLLGVITGGLKAVAAGELTRRYGYGTFSDLPTINSEGVVTPAAAPTTGPSAGAQFAEFVKSPAGLIVTAAALIGAAFLLARIVK